MPNQFSPLRFAVSRVIRAEGPIRQGVDDSGNGQVERPATLPYLASFQLSMSSIVKRVLKLRGCVSEMGGCEFARSDGWKTSQGMPQSKCCPGLDYAAPKKICRPRSQANAGYQAIHAAESTVALEAAAAAADDDRP